ncbi:hypothetical protein I5R58_04695 [Serratia marcescens]|nr:hypothetical protein [Serratia marcescens]MBH3275414.1 hypothetical protein [Serratia marcescens]MCW6026315.1 hypothetical protein [Serratia marcescens]UOG71864.1 hypothetical protein MJ023_001741 [Serratia marcescens]HCH6767668.1 hypothetical protein [Serratia marcescens]HEJ6942887.1 hypothetical protein [Serratia marcescens]
MKSESLVRLTDRLTGIAQGGLTLFADCRDEIGTIAAENGREKSGAGTP